MARLEYQVARLENYLRRALRDGVQLWRGEAEEGEELFEGEGDEASAVDLKSVETDRPPCQLDGVD